MPIYEYVCSKCGHPFEALVRGKEQPRCPKCGSTNLGKQFSLPAAHSHGGSSSSGDFRRAAPT
ncbi:MAG: zinc ribbon domain-containing protein [Candidatus Anammoximicrobium sp.]|nr:zinc ribbon domain-containing protein [Candidatus Anammoximicrobium sp.]